MIVCLSFDDGRSDNYLVAFPILVKYGLRATFHVTTGFIDGTFSTDVFGDGRAPLSVVQLKEMQSKEMEICSHGDRHITEDSDFLASYSKLVAWGLACDKKIGFSVPNSNCKGEELQHFFNRNQDKILYIRGGRASSCYSFFPKVNYVLFKTFGWQASYDRFNECNLKEKQSLSSFHSCVLKNFVTSRNIISFLSKWEKSDAFVILMLHSIDEVARDTYEWKTQYFEDLCSFLGRSNYIQTMTIREAVSNHCYN